MNDLVALILHLDLAVSFYLCVFWVQMQFCKDV